MASGMGDPCFVGKAHATTFRCAEQRASGRFDCFALSLALSHGERERITEIMFAEMMANGMGFSVFVGKAHATTARRTEQGASGGFDCFALSLALSHGEREQIAGNHSNGRTLVIRFPLPVGEGEAVWTSVIPIFKKPPFKTQTKEMVGHGCPTLFLNFKGLKNE